MLDSGGFGRFAEAARLVLVALRDGPRPHVRLFDDVRAMNGPIGPGTLYGAIARLERLGLARTRDGGALLELTPRGRFLGGGVTAELLT